MNIPILSDNARKWVLKYFPTQEELKDYTYKHLEIAYLVFDPSCEEKIIHNTFENLFWHVQKTTENSFRISKKEPISEECFQQLLSGKIGSITVKDRYEVEIFPFVFRFDRFQKPVGLPFNYMLEVDVKYGNMTVLDGFVLPLGPMWTLGAVEVTNLPKFSGAGIAQTQKKCF